MTNQMSQHCGDDQDQFKAEMVVSSSGEEYGSHQLLVVGNKEARAESQDTEKSQATCGAIHL